MKISYKLDDNIYSFKQEKNLETEKLNFLLTNNKGDFLNLGVQENVCKYQGLNLCNSENLEIFKILDSIILPNLECTEVESSGYSILRKFGSKVAVDVDNNSSEISTSDRFYLGPSGGMIYEVKDYDGFVLFDLDIKKLNDFDEWGRDYNVYEKDGIVFVEYTKKVEDTEDYKIYFGVKTQNFVYDLSGDWIKKEYSYSKTRGSLSERYVYRLLSTDIIGDKKFYIGYGFSEEEITSQISLLEKHQNELEKFDEAIYNDLTKKPEFETLINEDSLTAYRLSKYSMYNFLNKNLETEHFNFGSFAGLPWFSQIWTRDELVGIKGLIDNDETNLVKEKLFDYLNLIDIESGLLKRIDEEGSLESADGVFWLAKRFDDFIYYLENKKILSKVLSLEDIDLIYTKFYFSFEKIIEKFWDEKVELLKVKDGDSWMDTISVEYPMDIQVQFLKLVSFLTFLARILQKDRYASLLDFEDLLKSKIREGYFRKGFLYNELNEDKITSNVFLAYYIYPDLFLNSDWELIFDKSLKVLKTNWGGISSLSKKDNEFKADYTGENNLSYHKGDSWFWINNIAAMAMFEVDEKKYRKEISKILSSSTSDILKMGTIGYSSEISSASSQKAEGSMAQLWSSTTYIEMIDKLFSKKN